MWFSRKTAERIHKEERDRGIEVPRIRKVMSKAEKMLTVGTFGICTGVWTTLAYLIYINSL